MKRSLKRLDSVHHRLLGAVSPLGPELFSKQPSQGEWSVAQIVQHLWMVEERVIKDLEIAIAKEPQKIGLLRKLVPTSIVASRLLRVKSPKGVTPVEVIEKEAAIENFDRARNSLKQLVATHGHERFRKLVFKHPFLGKIDGVATISFVGYHEQRHYKQILEVLRKLGGARTN
jgi:hypothetical protein